MLIQINEGVRRLLWVGEKQKVKTLQKFFRWFGNENTGKLEFVASDMWKPYLKVIARKAKNALNVLDRFHIVKMMNDAVNDVKKLMHINFIRKQRSLFFKNPAGFC